MLEQRVRFTNSIREEEIFEEEKKFHHFINFIKMKKKNTNNYKKIKYFKAFIKGGLALERGLQLVVGGK